MQRYSVPYNSIASEQENEVTTNSTKMDAEEPVNMGLSPSPTHDSNETLFFFSKKKKKKKRSKTRTKEAAHLYNEDGRQCEEVVIPYISLLERCFKQMKPNLSVRKPLKIPPPQIFRANRKIVWDNFPKACSALRREKKHVQAFVVNELGVEREVTNDSQGRLVIRGSYKPKQFESVLRNYISSYVTCKVCKSPETTLTRDPITRLQFLDCVCGARRSVKPIQTLYRATMRGERRKERNSAK
eukprot:jgi/Bigna1/53505/estExt_Genewise1Plus.C_200087